MLEETGTRAKVDDPRYIRVRASLVRALFELARTTPVDEIPVSQLASAAGVSRTTFYSHAASPAQLLADVLVDEFRPDLERIAGAISQPGADYVALWRELYGALLTHVARHAQLYRTMLESNSLALSFILKFLEQISSRTVDAVIAQFSGERTSPLWRTMAIQQQVRNTVAMIVAWLRTDMADPIPSVIETYLTLAPPWQLARPDASGQIVMRRGRSASVSDRPASPLPR